MLQTIYEAESSFAADSVVSKEKSLSLGVQCQWPVAQSLTAGAAASSEVKQRLQEFVLSKKQRIAPGVTISLSRYHNLWMQHYATMEQNSASQNISQAALHPGLLSCDPKNDFPLRKTASEPNLKLRSRLKQKVAERRSSPLLRRKGVMALVKKRPIDISESPVSSSAPGSGPSSPSNGNISVSLLNGTTAIIPAKPKHATELRGATEGNADSLSLHTSPSLPNISLGLPLSGAVQTAHLSAIMALSAKQQQQQTAKSCSSGPSGPFASSLPLYLISRRADAEHGVGHSSSQPDLLRTTGPKTEAGPLPAQLLPVLLAGERPRLPHRRILNRTHSSPLPQSLQALHHLLRQQQLLANQRQAVPAASSPEVHRPSMQTSKDEEGMTKSQQDEVVPMQEDDDEISVKESHHIPTSNDNQKVELETILCDEVNDRIPNNITVEDKQVFSLYQKTTSPDLPHAGCQGKPPTGPLLPKAISRRSLFRTQSSPAFTLLPQPVIPTIRKPVFTTGLVYDVLMLKHQCVCGDINNHPEHTGRIQSIWSRLQETGLLNKCERVCGRKATLEELQLVHTEQHTLMYGTNQLNRRDSKQLQDTRKAFSLLPCGGLGVDSDTVWNELHSASAARMAAGCVAELACKVASGDLKNGFAVVRPPGHHAEESAAMGFCFFNSVAIAAKVLQQKMNQKKILIVDWDVHHGNGIQQAFYNDGSVLYMSIHRYDDGCFFPGSGAPEEVGVGDGVGFNVNIAWTGVLDPPMGDPEYLAAFRMVLLPIAHDFDPDIVLISAGFDAAIGHPPPLGGYKVSSACFGYLTQQLMELAGGRLVLALEGGHDLTAICDASEACVSALLGSQVMESVKFHRCIR
uniref:Histone deacetylase n=1 Tax=Eptatretus burgeri TaxID=7764 RepID=A0A8C4R980_EPTBU